MVRPSQDVDPQRSPRHLVGATIRHWRHEVRDITLTEFAATLPIDRSQLSKWERAEVPVPADQIARIDNALGAAGAIIAVHQQATELHRLRRIHETGTTNNRATVGGGPLPPEGDDDVKRRAVLHLLAALGTGTAIPPGTVETVLAGVDRAAGGDRIDLDEWERTVYDHGQQINTRSAGVLVGDLTADVIAVGHLLDQRRLTPVEQAGLLRVSAGLAGLLAIDLGDVGDERAARVSWGTARRTADASGDRELRVWVRGRAAREALWAKRSNQVVTALADEAIGIADGAPSDGLAMAYAAHADVAIGQGDTAGAHAALGDLKRTFDHLPGDTAAEQTVFGFRESQLCWSESYVYTQAGDGQAAATLERARALYPPSSSAPLANLSLMQAMSMVKAREIDAGLAYALDTFQDHPRMSAGARLITGHIIGALPAAARSLPAARELHALTTGA